MLLYSPDRTLTLGDFDYDWDNNGTLDLPAGAQIIDLMAIKDDSDADFVYPASGISAFTAAVGSSRLSRRCDQSIPRQHHPRLGQRVVPRRRYRVGRRSVGLQSESGFATGLPAPGAAATPGELNTGTPAQSPLVSLTSVTPNLPSGTVTAVFTGNVTQSLNGTGSGDRGVSITDTSGNAVVGVDVAGVVAGLGTNTLTLSFTGPGVVGGILPAGQYRLTFLGNGLIGNGRAVDAANNGTLTGSNFQFTFTQPEVGLDGDYDGNNQVDGHDFLAWQQQLGGPGARGRRQ